MKFAESNTRWLFFLVLVFLSFFVPSSVSAETQYCCERTTSGASCVQAPAASCDPAYASASGSCANTAFCRPVCCVTDTICAPNTGASQCSALQGTAVPENPTCDGVAACQEGCCQLGNSCFLSTQNACQNLAASYPSLEGKDVWDEQVTSEGACQNLCLDVEEGCCVDPDNGCTYGSRDTCDERGGATFHSGIFCSSTPLKDSCSCTPHAEKQCSEDGGAVYWFDSCGQREEQVETCNYADRLICRQSNGTAACASLDCADTQDYPTNTHDPNLGGPRTHGESWCVYEGPTGPGLDPVGSRHARHYCYAGEEKTELCGDFRQSRCVYNSTQGFAGCVDVAVDECLSCKRESCCDVSLCAWKSSSSSARVRSPPDLPSPQSSFFSGASLFVSPPPIVSAGLSQPVRDEGACVPLIPPGLNFWGGEEAGAPDFTDAKKLCNKGTLRCTSIPYYATKHIPYDPRCGNNEWMEYANEYCRSFGDCGAASSVYGESTETGQRVRAPSSKTKVESTCLPWRPPETNNCRLCAEHYGADCTLYKCKTLGRNCKLLNEGTEKVACSYIDPNDVAPPRITPWLDVMNQSLSVQLTSTGYYVEYTGEGGPEIPPFYSLPLGIALDEPAICRYDEKHTASFEEMEFTFGDEDYTDRKLLMNLVEGGKETTYYVRCQDLQGRANIEEYSIQFVTDPEPDREPPRLLWTDPESESFVSHEQHELPVQFVLSEPAHCLWSGLDQEYDQMPADHGMICTDKVIPNAVQGDYDCRAVFPVVPGNASTFFVRCQDLSGNSNRESFAYALRGSVPLIISEKYPAGDVQSPDVEIVLVTSGGAEDGTATCQLRGTGVPQFIDFFDTNVRVHKQALTLGNGGHVFDVRCEDAAENSADDKLFFTITAPEEDIIPPRLVSVYTSGTVLYLITDEVADCRYHTTDPDFAFEQGTVTGAVGFEHKIVGTDARYYVQCRDVAQNGASFIVYR